LVRFTVPLTIDGVDLQIAAARRDGTGEPLVFLHGFGSTKEDYADVIQQPGLADRPVLACDAPGCGATTCSDLSAVNGTFLVRTARGVLDAEQIGRLHLVGHSIGGLTGLLLADADPTRVGSFTDIEGNLAPEDRFLSRQIIDHHHPDPHGFLDEFVERVWTSRVTGSALYASALPHKVRAGVIRAIFTSMVDLSDHGNLLRRFLALPFPRMVMFGDQNAGLTYLPALTAAGVELAEIPRSGHFPMYSNAPAMWDRITRFITTASNPETPS
jgi:pimeloyl-ACP methyl ester carboxylesterase